MTELAELGIEIKADDIRKAVRELDRLERQGEQTEKATSKLTRTTRALNKSYSGLGAIIGAAGLGLAMRSIIKATVEQERAMKQLETAVESTGGTAGFTARELADFASELQDVTTFGDEAIISMQSVLLTFTNLKDDVLPQTTEAVLNLSTRMGQDLQSSAVMLGKALNDPVSNLGALSRSGIQFSDEQKEVIKDLADTNRLAEAQGIILEELETQFGGAAKAARDTFGGALAGLRNTLGDLLEADGGSLKEAQEAVEGLTQALQDPEVQESLASITSGVVNLTSAFANALPTVVEFTEWIADEFAAAIYGVDNDDIPRMEMALSDIQEQIREIDDGKFQLSDLWTSAAHKEALEKEAAQLKENIELAYERQQSLRNRGRDGSEGDEEQQGRAMGMTAPDGEEEFEEKLEKEKERNQIMESLEEAHMIKIGDIQKNALTDIAKFREMSWKQQTSTVVGELEQMTRGVAQQNKAMFEINKVAGIANAIINTSQGVTKALSAYPPPLSFAMAAAQATAGFAQVNAIRSQSFSGGGGGSAPSLAGSGGGGDTVNTVPVGQQQEEQRPQQQLIVNLGDDDRPVSKSWVRDNLIPTIKDAQKDGYVLA